MIDAPTFPSVCFIELTENESRALLLCALRNHRGIAGYPRYVVAFIHSKCRSLPDRQCTKLYIIVLHHRIKRSACAWHNSMQPV